MAVKRATQYIKVANQKKRKTKMVELSKSYINEKGELWWYALKYYTGLHTPLIAEKKLKSKKRK